MRRASKDAPPRDKPLVTAMMQGQRRVIASVDQAAAQLGLSRGMTVTHAQSLVPDLTVIEATPDDDEAALIRLALWCIKYSPLVTPDPPDGVFIDVAGSAHLFQGEAALINDLCRRLGAEGIAARAALADTAGCAWALARHGDAQIVSPGRAADAIASLPVGCLRLSPETVSSLGEVGIERVAQTDPAFVETAVVDAFLKIDRHGTERGQAPPPIAPRINVCGTNRSEFV